MTGSQKAQHVAKAPSCACCETSPTGMPCDATDNDDEETAPLERVRSVACQTTPSHSKCRRIRSDDCYRRSGSSSEGDSYESDDSVYHQRSAYTRRSRSFASMYCRRVVRNIRSKWPLFVRLTVEIVMSCMVLGYFLDSFVHSHYGVGIVSTFKSVITYGG